MSTLFTEASFFAPFQTREPVVVSVTSSADEFNALAGNLLIFMRFTKPNILHML